MPEPSSPTPPAPSWKKLLLIPVLGVVLLYVIWSPSDQVAVPKLVARPPVPQPASSFAPSPAGANPVSGATSATGTGTVAVMWPATPIADVLVVNPFKMPAELKPPVATVDESSPLLVTSTAELNELELAKTAELRDALKGQRLTALVQTSKGVGAIVGDAVVAVGDIVGERLRVTAIRPEGVTLELIDKPAKPEAGSDK